MKRNHPLRKPRWWPEDEPWPPVAPAARGRFVRRMGCMLVVFVMLMTTILFLLFGLLAHLFGLLPLSREVAPLGVGMFLFGLALLLLSFRRLRRMTASFQSLFDASERVAAGDFSARAEEMRGYRDVNMLARAFNEMAARLQISDEQRRTLLAEVTHELRTPLTVIRGNLEGMLDGVYPRDDAHLQMVLEETELLARLVDDLRTLALAESGALQLHKEAVDLGVLVGATVAAFRPEADAVGVELRIANILPDESLTLDLDPERIKQVLVNLLTNALRYAGQGGMVEVRLGVEDHDPSKAWLEVYDNGAGIAPEDLPHIFDRFYKGRDSRGMGLGLSIAKKLVEAHGATIRAESSPQSGTTIRVDDL